LTKNDVFEDFGFLSLKQAKYRVSSKTAIFEDFDVFFVFF
jgi:hypothetical protein